MVKLAAEIVCLWKASSVFPSGKKYQGAGVWIGTEFSALQAPIQMWPFHLVPF